jgi:hypothetical protein
MSIHQAPGPSLPLGHAAAFGQLRQILLGLLLEPHVQTFDLRRAQPRQQGRRQGHREARLTLVEVAG